MEAGDLCELDQVGFVDFASRGDDEDGVNLARDHVLLAEGLEALGWGASREGFAYAGPAAVEAVRANRRTCENVT